MHKPSEPNVIREDLLVKLFSGGLVSVSVLIADVERHRRIHVEKLLTYREIEQEKCSISQFSTKKEKLKNLVLMAGIKNEQAWIDWCDETLEALKNISLD
jgi:hypothetical protein